MSNKLVKWYVFEKTGETVEATRKEDPYNFAFWTGWE